MPSVTTDLDMGDLGTNEVVIQYRNANGLLHVTSVLWEGLDLMDKGYIQPTVEDVLSDACRANEAEEVMCAAEAYWDAKREARLLGEAA